MKELGKWALDWCDDYTEATEFPRDENPGDHHATSKEQRWIEDLEAAFRAGFAKCKEEALKREMFTFVANEDPKEYMRRESVGVIYSKLVRELGGEEV